MKIGNREAVSAYLDVPQKKALDAIAKERKVKLAQIVREAVDVFLKSRRKEKAS